MKKIAAFFMVLTLLAPLAVFACQCCPSMSAPEIQPGVSLNSVPFSSCCLMLALVKECAPVIKKFIQNSQEFLILFFQTGHAGKSFSIQPLFERGNPPPGGPDFLSQPPRYLALNILRI